MIRRSACFLVVVAVSFSQSAVAQEGGDVVVRSTRLRDWRAVLVVGRGDVVTCRTLRSTGDAALDTRACAAKLTCYDAVRPRLVAARGRRALAAINRDIDGCFAALATRITGDPPGK